jgi:hypothetical protein
MDIFKLATPISSHENKKKYLNHPQKHLLESILASICGASIPAIIFYLVI